MSDLQRLYERLKSYDMVEKKVAGDRNCQFRALSDQLYRTTKKHKFLRNQVVEQLKSHAEIYSGFVPLQYDKYLKKMSRNGKWGNHLTLQAAADLESCFIEILPAAQKSSKVVMLSFRVELHYNSVYPDGGAELVELQKMKKKKKWWSFGH